MTRPELEHVRRIALALPGVNERESHGARCFFIRDRIALCYVHDNHRGDGRISLWRPAPPGVQEEMVAAEPDRFFRPPTSAQGTFAGWLGLFIDSGSEEWNEVATMIEESFRLVAPRELVSELNRGTAPEVP